MLLNVAVRNADDVRNAVAQFVVQFDSQSESDAYVWINTQSDTNGDVISHQQFVPVSFVPVCIVASAVFATPAVSLHAAAPDIVLRFLDDV